MLHQNLIEKIKEDLVKHEGYVTEIYLCSEGYPTFGIGHMVTEDDMEYTWPVGTPVTDERILDVQLFVILLIQNGRNTTLSPRR